MTSVPGCHGIGVAPAAIGLELGWLDEAPAQGVEVELVEAVEREPHAELVWQLDEPPGFGLGPITTQTWLEPDDSVWVGNTLNMSLRVDHRRSAVSVAAKGGNMQVVLEALANLALPLVAQRSGALVLHASAAAFGGSAVMISAESGSGKSSLLMGLLAAGGDALSEDQCVLDLDREGRHRIWPGPSWVRLKVGAPAPPLVQGRMPRFEALDKLGWDIREQVAHSPARLDRIVLLEPPGGAEVVWAPLPAEDVIAALMKRATWFQRQDGYAASVLPSLVKLAMSVPGFRMRIPRRADWLELAVGVLAGQ